jgi:hypothetical protein
MGRARRRARQAHPPGALPTVSAARETVGRAPDGQAWRAHGGGRTRNELLGDKEWRKAERRRVLLLNLLPGPFQDVARRGRAGLLLVVAVQMALVVVAGLVLCRVTTGNWLPRYAGVVVLGLAVASQAVCRSVNTRAQT